MSREEILIVLATQYGVINTGGRCRPSLPWHDTWLKIIDEWVMNQCTCASDP